MVGGGIFDSTDAFKRAFVPHDDGYLYYAKVKSGGKFITQAEFDDLVRNWQRVSSRRGIWTVVGLVLVGIFGWTAIVSALNLPGWADEAAVPVAVVLLCGYIFWAGLAPWRLVRNRPVVAPPRASDEVGRLHRATLKWRFVTFILIVSGLLVFNKASATKRSLEDWLWLSGGGILFVAYLRIAVLKWRDRRVDGTAS